MRPLATAETDPPVSPGGEVREATPNGDKIMRYGNSKEGMSEHTAAKRNRSRREKLRAAGLAPLQVWVPRSCRKKVRAYVARMLARRSIRGPKKSPH